MNPLDFSKPWSAWHRTKPEHSSLGTPAVLWGQAPAGVSIFGMFALCCISFSREFFLWQQQSNTKIIFYNFHRGWKALDPAGSFQQPTANIYLLAPLTGRGSSWHPVWKGRGSVGAFHPPCPTLRHFAEIKSFKTQCNLLVRGSSARGFSSAAAPWGPCRSPSGMNIQERSEFLRVWISGNWLHCPVLPASCRNQHSQFLGLFHS